MRINKYTYLVLGFVALFGIIAFSQFSGFSTDMSNLAATGKVNVQTDGFSTDSSILTMELPAKEGYKTIPKFTLKTNYPVVPDELGIYNIKAPPVSTESTKKLAETKLKNKSPNVKEDDTSYSLATSSSYLSVDKKSGAETVIMDVPGLSEPRKKGLPSEDKLKQNADAYVKENSLLPTGYAYSGASYITRQEVGKEGALGAAEPVTGIVKYGRILEGLNIEGPGSSICVFQGEDGIVLGYTKVSREIGAKKAKSSVKSPSKDTKEVTFKLLTPEEAFKKLQERGLTIEIANVDTATVDQMYLAYYESEPNKKQDVIEPIYVFQGTATGPGGSVPYKEYMYALSEKDAKGPSQISDKQAGKSPERNKDAPATTGPKDPEIQK